jgi:hypothetical protein
MATEFVPIFELLSTRYSERTFGLYEFRPDVLNAIITRAVQAKQETLLTPHQRGGSA